MNIRNNLKRIVLNYLPEKLLKITKKVYYSRVLRNLSENDEVDLKVIKNLVKPGENVIDIGANIGVYTKFLSNLVGINGRVFSVEPIPLTFEILSLNMRNLKLKNIELINYAISDTNGCVTMEVPLYEETAGENFYQARIVDENINSPLRRIKVESRTIDSLFSDPYIISFIKCDVEGHELKCIRGAMGIIKNLKPAWLIEFSEDPDDIESTTYETFRILNEEGYKAFWFDGKMLRKRRIGDNSVNYFFFAQKHLEQLQGKRILESDVH